MAGYGKIIQGQKAQRVAKGKGSYRGILAKYGVQSAGISALWDTVNLIGQEALSIGKGISENKKSWTEMEAGAKELGMGEEFADKKGEASWWKRKVAGPGEEFRQKSISKTEDGQKRDITLGELKTMGKIKREGGSRFLKTYDPLDGSYKDVKESGWGTLSDVEKGGQTLDAAQSDSPPPVSQQEDSINAGISNYGESTSPVELPPVGDASEIGIDTSSTSAKQDSDPVGQYLNKDLNQDTEITEEYSHEGDGPAPDWSKIGATAVGSQVEQPAGPQGFSSLSEEQQTQFGKYATKWGESGPEFGDGTAENQYNSLVGLESQSVQGMANQLGYDVGGGEEEWQKYGGGAFGKKSRGAYGQMYNQWMGMQ